MEPEFEIGQRVRVRSVSSKHIESEIVDRFKDEEGQWFYSLDRRNYLHEPMLEESRS